MGNLYETLGVTRQASAQEIKRAYHRLAHQYHPDKNPGDHAAEERFRTASRAYDILSDARKRRRYDRFGPTAVGLGPEATFRAADFAQNLGASMGELFQEIFKRHRASPASMGATPAAQAGHAQTYELEIELATAVGGGQVPLQVSRPQRCGTCVGTGAKPGTVPQICTQCRGAGALRVQQGVFRINKRCQSCAGQGRLTAHPCAHCHGEGVYLRPATLHVRIPRGAQNDTLLRLRGDAKAAGAQRSADIWAHLTVRPHALFRRENDNLTCQWPITIVEAALGGLIQLPLLDGSRIQLDIPPGTQSGQILTVAGQGAYSLGQAARGDLHVTITVEVPENLDAATRLQLNALRHLDDTAAHYPRCAAKRQIFKGSEANA